MAEDKRVGDQMAVNQMDSKFINQLIRLPVVDNTWAQLATYYALAKDYNAVTRFALSTAESGALKMYNTAQPVLNKYQPQISKVDNFASDQLTKMEDKYPVLKKTPEEIVTEGKEMYSHYVQPAVDKVNSVKEFSSSTLSSVKQNIVSLESSKEYGKKQMLKATEYTQGQVIWLLQTDYGQQLLHQVEIYLTMSQDKLDEYLPPDEVDRTHELPQETSIERVGSLSKRITRRVYAKAIKDLKNAQANTKEAVEKLLASLGLLETMQNNYDASKQMIQNLHEKLVTTWSDITAEEDPSACKPDAEKTVSQNHDVAITMLRRLTRQVKDNVNKIYSTMPETPAVVKQLAEESYNHAESLYTSVKQAKNLQEISVVLYSKTTESILGLQQVLQTLIETPLSYVQSLPVPEETEMVEMAHPMEKSDSSLHKEDHSYSPVLNEEQKTNNERGEEKINGENLREKETKRENVQTEEKDDSSPSTQKNKKAVQRKKKNHV